MKYPFDKLIVRLIVLLMDDSVKNSAAIKYSTN